MCETVKKNIQEEDFVSGESFFFTFFDAWKQSFSQNNTNGTKIKKFKDTCIVFVWVKRNSGLLCCETNIWKKNFMCVTNSKQKFHMWNKNENILWHFVYFMCENNRIILYIYLKKKCELSFTWLYNQLLSRSKQILLWSEFLFPCMKNHDILTASHLKKTFASPYKKTLTSPSGLQ